MEEWSLYCHFMWTGSSTSMLPNQVSSSMTVFCSNSLASSLCIVQNFPCAQFLSCKNRYGITYYTLKSTKSTNHPTNQPATLLTLFWFEQYHIHDTHYYYIQTTRTLVQDNLDVETTTPESPLSKKISRIVALVPLLGAPLVDYLMSVLNYWQKWHFMLEA